VKENVLTSICIRTRICLFQTIREAGQAGPSYAAISVTSEAGVIAVVAVVPLVVMLFRAAEYS
jgi:hypothetical protein